jgi:carbamate kinase
LEADALLLLTDVAAVQDGYGTPQARTIRRATPAAIGQLGDAQTLLAGQAGTLVVR